MSAQGKMCPILTVNLIELPKSTDGIPDVSGGINAMACQGEACAWWVPIADETGRVIRGAGNCALPLAAVALSQINVAVTPQKPLIKKG